MFATGTGVPEDPVTGSAHCMLAPYWSQKLADGGALQARQVSARGGDVEVEWDKDSARVRIRGAAITASTGTIFVPSELI